MRNPIRAIDLANKALELDPQNAETYVNLGEAQYRAGDWNAAVVALKKGMKLDKDGKEGGAGFFLAMAHWQLGDKEQARMCYSQAVQWMENNEADDPEELCRFRDEAAALLRLKVPKD